MGWQEVEPHKCRPCTETGKVLRRHEDNNREDEMRVVQDTEQLRATCFSLSEIKPSYNSNIIEKSLKLSFTWQHPSSKGEKHITSELDLV